MWKLIERLEATSDAVAVDSVTLPFELRMRGRLKAVSDNGREIGLFLDRGPVLRDGALLRAETGEIVAVRAADEPVVTAKTAAGLVQARLCYHLGNRHVQLAIGGDEAGGWVRFPPDHVLEALATRLGATLEHHRAPFDPEPGAYAEGHGHDHGPASGSGGGQGHEHSGQSHDHSHGHSQGHSQGHAHYHPHDPVHGHGQRHAQVYDFQRHLSHRDGLKHEL
ncbi:urease accessory protein UreE [Salinicola sp. MH3R3-1]|uniref:urease accessory protein UreE n=1 Tax=Salinicola sp. MH3R3-1 TaxID=1928762 RepID=UPI00094F1427|nr:urease accessory protein UreE [Salinicola sp. MH3R3-1]OLO07348.1 urease accessory protein UreE [Salinicola sp. MH3R3-1]